MRLPFTVDQFLAVFEQYNRAIWPMHILMYGLGLAAVLLAVTRVRYADRIISGILAFFWLWIGIAYHIVSFSTINTLAYGFGALFIVQSVVFVWVGVVRPNLTFGARMNGYVITGAVFMLYAMLGYPIIGTLLGHGYPQSPSFGVAPCPTTIFTFGLLLWTTSRVPKYTLIIPLVWAAIGFMAALSLGIREDIGLLVAGVIGAALVLWRDYKGRVQHGPRPRYA